uniref:Nematode cuticle collagen N-terminal domain-containing protein n=1 Tax=Meloidogyne floridensis TaxID=298350 RepID=A0A915PC15_9BILA
MSIISKKGSEKVFISSTISLCAIITITSIFAIISLFNDLNSFYSEIYNDLEDFNGIANDAWNKLIKESNSYDFKQRFRRQYEQQPQKPSEQKSKLLPNKLTLKILLRSM